LQVLNEKKLKHVDNIFNEFTDAASANEMYGVSICTKTELIATHLGLARLCRVKLKAFYKFESTAEASLFLRNLVFPSLPSLVLQHLVLDSLLLLQAMSAAASLVESKLGKELKKFLKKNIVKKELTDELGVADTKLGGIIKDKLGVQCVADSTVMELQRGIRNQLVSLVEGLDEAQLRAMQLGLAHTLSRYKLKFSPDKVDTMIVQAVGLLDDLDKEVNTYAMRVKEWFGWHFPEMAKIGERGGLLSSGNSDL
jgi:hypothetical protein